MPRNIRVFDHGRPTLGVVVPCHNEAEVLARTHARLTRALASLAAFDCELIHVDDGSADDTWHIANLLAKKSGSVRAVKPSRNFGHQAACLAGLREAVGAVELLPPTSGAGPLRTPADVDAYCDRVRPGDWELVSVHGMGSCPMSLPERGGVGDEAGRPHGFTNLRLCDASVLPGAPGISPQGTIMSFAREIVGRHLESA
ncbi:glycosyltransferase [Streptomyces diastatochromogenes]|uniref:glycosyltransferase n=1 Tax=Streptomyces diastatochromogenes TaxID=42236 RepID=UPI0036C656E3